MDQTGSSARPSLIYTASRRFGTIRRRFMTCCASQRMLGTLAGTSGSTRSQCTVELAMKTIESNVGCVVRGSHPYKSQQGPLYTPAISAETVGARSLFFGIVTIPPGERTKAHVHQFHESAFYVL